MITRVHELVSKTFTDAVTRPTGGCCGGSAPKGVLAKIAGYSPTELAMLPADAVANSFGCGNPLAFSEVLPGQVVLDLGSGAGIDLLIAAKRVGPAGRVIGVDMTDAMILRACENIAGADATNVEVRKGLIEALPVETESVDWVISNCVINLSPDKPKVFTEIARVLKPGGRLRVSDIVVEDFPTALRDNAALYGSCVAGAISEREYLAGLKAAGLADVEVRERLVYEASQLYAMAFSELDEAGAALARGLAGKVWSALFFARKPRHR
jgi:arsenite methyltransferase